MESGTFRDGWVTWVADLTDVGAIIQSVNVEISTGCQQLDYYRVWLRLLNIYSKSIKNQKHFICVITIVLDKRN